MSTLMMVPQDEHCIQQMLGVSTVPAEVQAEYMIRLRLLHRVIGGGPLGPIACIDLLRSLEYSPPSPTSGGDPNKIDWHQIPIGTPVQIQREEGVWSPRDIVFKFVGFVDNGTFAIESPSGRVDEYYKRNVRLVEDDLPNDLDKSSFNLRDEAEEKTARQKAYEQQEIERLKSLANQPPSQVVIPQNAVDSSPSTGDTGSSNSQGSQGDDPKSDTVSPADDSGDDATGDPLAIGQGQPPTDWSKVTAGAVLWARWKGDTYEATFVNATESRVRVVLRDDAEKKERLLRFDQVMLTEGA